MKKIYCDICNTEIKKVSLLTLPNLWNGEVVDCSEPYELCKSCARHIYEIIRDYKEIMKNAEKKI